MAADIQDGKFTDVKGKKNEQESKPEGKVKRILRAIGREVMFTVIGAAAVGAVWGYTAKKDSKKDESFDEDKKSDEESEDKD